MAKPAVAPVAVSSEAGVNLLHALAYELKAPLTHIAWTAAMLRSGDFNPEEIPEQLERIEVGSERLLHLLDSLIYAGRIGLKQEPLPLAPVSLSAVVKDVSSAMAPLANRHGTDIRLNVTHQLQPALAHKPALTHALFGLVDSIVRTTESELIEVLIHHQLDKVMMTFRDDGEVLTTHSVRRAMDRLGKSPEPVTALAGSSGVGLYVASVLSDAMQVDLQTYHHHGKRLFSLSLPQSRQLALGI